jgi:hypothetical protein
MKTLQLLSANILCGLFLLVNLKAEVIYVSSQLEFDASHDGAAMDDSIIWRAGTYSDIYMNITKDHLLIAAEELGATIFTGASRVNIAGDFIALKGFQFLDGNIGTKDVINTSGSYNIFTQINIRAYTCYKYLRVREESQFVEITYCNFENRLNLDDQNILSILVDETNPGYHKIQHCSFKNFDGTGNDMGIEPIRIGLSTQADHISRSLVEHCYFTQCNGDGEIISSKASQNVYRYNTFENNPKAELVLRHGSDAIVYGNFFLNGKGGIRVREGQNHYIYNNYFFELDDRAIYLQNRDSDPLDNINIAFNTIVDCSEIILGGDGNDKPTNVTFANNIFTDPDDSLFEEPTGTETWIGNVAFGDLGIPIPISGMTMIDPVLSENSEGFFGLTQNSPAIDAARPGYALLPQYEGIEGIDMDILFDLMGQNRSALIEEKDLGCNEYPHSILIQPMATEENTGPSYNTSMTTSLQAITHIVKDLIRIHPNPVLDQLNIEINSKSKANLRIDIFDIEGKSLDTIIDKTIFPGETTIMRDIDNLPPGVYSIRAMSQDLQKGAQRIQTIKFIKS